MLQLLWKQLAQQEKLIDELDGKIKKQTRPLAAELDRLDAIPGRFWVTPEATGASPRRPDEEHAVECVRGNSAVGRPNGGEANRLFRSNGLRRRLAPNGRRVRLSSFRSLPPGPVYRWLT